jgi:hypothetical protein
MGTTTLGIQWTEILLAQADISGRFDRAKLMIQIRCKIMGKHLATQDTTCFGGIALRDFPTEPGRRGNITRSMGITLDHPHIGGNKMGKTGDLIWGKMAAIIFILPFFGCASISKRQAFPYPGGDIKIRENKIFINDRPFAEMRFLQNKRDVEDKTFSGIAIFYFSSSKEMWVFPKGGTKIDGRAHSLEEIKRMWAEFGTPYYLSKVHPVARNVQITEDGKEVHFEASDTVLSPLGGNANRYVYYIPDGVIKKSE